MDRRRKPWPRQVVMPVSTPAVTARRWRSSAASSRLVANSAGRRIRRRADTGIVTGYLAASVEGALVVEALGEGVWRAPGVDERVEPLSERAGRHEHSRPTRCAGKLVQVAHPEIGIDTCERLREE